MAINTTALNQAMDLAQAHEKAGRFSEAEAAYRQMIANDQQFHPAYHALGLLAFNAGNLGMAADLLRAAVALDNKKVLYQRNYGEMCRRLGRLDEAITAGKAACKLAPKDIDAHYNLGLAYTDAKDYAKAIEAYRKALELDPKHGLSWNNLGSALEQQGDKTAALEAYTKAVALNPRHAEAQNNAGAIFSEQGKLDEARASFEAAIDAKSDFVEAHYNLSSLKTYKKDDPHLAMLEGVYANRNALSNHARIRYSFALGKALDDIGQYERAFAAYDEGNKLQHAILPMDERHADAMLENIMQIFDAKFFADRQAWQVTQDAKRTPVFIVGMPRSGTTLLEQILCSHASVYGAGELSDLNEVISKVMHAQQGKPFTEGVQALSEADVRHIGEDYLKRVWKLSPESAFITDKMPANFFYLGLIHLALPNAKIIHAMRDPMDSCFSCYSRLFNDTMEFAYDQGTLGRYYARYIKLMQHWHKVLPAGTILDLPYEKMVDDTEAQARRVLEFVGLPWDENCLQFHKNDRLVKTASVAQVRKPIYKTSVARWKHFGQHLTPLLRLVQDYRQMDESDIALLLAAPVLPQAEDVNAEALHVQGIAQYKAGRFDAALDFYNRALTISPDLATALNSKGFLLQDMDRMQEALACFQQAVELAPEMAMARLNLGMAQLKIGDWAQGWENYEARWTGSAEAGIGSFSRPACVLPQWAGQVDTANKRLLVIAEQGFGDTFQFARYLPLAAERFAKVGFVCSQPTQRLIEWAFGDQISTFTRLPVDVEAWDFQCPLMSLPRAFKTRVETIPAAMPTFKVANPAAQHWKERLEISAPQRFYIGVAWAGRKSHQYDARRSLRFEQLLPLLDDTRVTWVSLQKWAPEDQRPVIPEQFDWLDWTEELTDFADTAALVANLDLVISIDSSMIHLAGALNKPVWMMNRFDTEWRWLRQRDDSPWYPSLRIFNQPTLGDWTSVLNNVAEALKALPIQSIGKSKPRKDQQVSLQKEAELPVPAMGLSIEQAMQLASQHQSAGRLQQSEQLLLQILQANPNHAHAMHLLGVVAYQAGKADLALELIVKAIAVESDVALFHSNLAEMLRQQGRVQESIKYGQQAVEIEPSMASAHGNLGIALYDAKDYDAAEVAHLKALDLSPTMLQSLNNLGSIERARKNLKLAAEWYQKALNVNADYIESLSNLGAVLVEDDDADAAIAPLERALQLQPNYPEALCNLGLSRLKQERINDAVALLQRSLQIRPDYPEALIGMARAMHELDRPEEAESYLWQATEKSPENADAWCQLAGACIEQGKIEQAEDAYNKALAIDMEMSDALAGLGHLRLEQGKIDDAEHLIKQAISIKPDNIYARFHLTQVKKVQLGDENLTAMEALIPEIETMKGEKRISLHYALGKAYDDLKQYDKGFPHYIEGARLKRAKLHYDADADAARSQRIIDIIDNAFIERLQGAGDLSDLPIFVLGMPRSGTTLTEQIIASHPQVHGAGELVDLMQAVQQPVQGQVLQFYPENLAQLNQETLTQWGQQYVSGLRQRAPNAKRITDKMPTNYLAMGLIPLMLPNAKIIHVKRNPVDTCVSCFTGLFNCHQDATYDLVELGRHYLNYTRLMHHWQQVMPQDSFIEVQYEDIVADMEGQARRLIDFCGIEWDDACLNFHKNKRNIRTASVTQVRQPIYTSSVERWRNYEKYLGPLLDTLGDLVTR